MKIGLLYQVVTVFYLICSTLQDASQDQGLDCLNNGTEYKKKGVCQCSDDYIGRYCQYPALPLSERLEPISLAQNQYALAYYNPGDRDIYRLIISFCSPVATLDLKLFAQEQDEKSKFEQDPTDPRSIRTLTIKKGECSKLFSTVLVAVDKKKDGELPKIIFGFKLLSSEPNPLGEELFITVSCTSQTFFSIDFLTTIMVFFFVAAILFIAISLIFVFRKKYLERRRATEDARKKMECVTNIMPSCKYENLIEETETDENGKEVPCCSICLSEFTPKDHVRKTPCNHIFHKNCLDSWCSAHLTCPICRKDFLEVNLDEMNEGQEVQMMEEPIRPVENIREPML